VKTLLRCARVLAVLGFAVQFTYELSHGTADVTPLLGVLVFGTDLYRDVRGGGVPSVFLVVTAAAVTVAIAASTGHWALALVIVGLFTALRIWTWRINTRSSPTS
jgi:hypothetical protein